MSIVGFTDISSLLFNLLLKHAVETKRHYFQVSHFYQKYQQNLYPLKEIDIVNMVKNTEDIFKVNNFNYGEVFYLTEKVTFQKVDSYKCL